MSIFPVDIALRVIDCAIIMPLACLCEGIQNLCTCPNRVKGPRHQKRSHEIDTPIPLPRRRPRSLTQPSSMSPLLNKCTSRKPAARQQTLFLVALPPEIRLLIYQFLFDAPIHIYRRKHRQRLGHLRCHGKCSRRPREGDAEWTIPCWVLPNERAHLLFLRLELNGNRLFEKNMLPILLTCQDIYRETTPLLYSTPLFAMQYTTTLMDLASTTLPHRWNTIRKMQLMYNFDPKIENNYQQRLDLWRKACNLLKSISGLQWLKIGLDVSLTNLHWMIRSDKAVEVDLLGPLVPIRHVACFEVWISWELKDTRFTNRHMPFRLKRGVFPIF